MDENIPIFVDNISIITVFWSATWTLGGKIFLPLYLQNIWKILRISWMYQNLQLLIHNHGRKYLDICRQYMDNNCILKCRHGHWGERYFFLHSGKISEKFWGYHGYIKIYQISVKKKKVSKYRDIIIRYYRNNIMDISTYCR